MAIFRCTLCDDIFDNELRFDLDGIPFCGKCFSEYKDKLKPKKPPHPYENPFEKDLHAPPKTTKKKQKEARR